MPAFLSPDLLTGGQMFQCCWRLAAVELQKPVEIAGDDCV